MKEAVSHQAPKVMYALALLLIVIPAYTAQMIQKAASI